ncbi:hypothetical protein [Niallia endozanthoxylica]|uniref:Uncharacterized protein n=1 Tax=Niallia endozanthoxylica TaxID=2036016 RepID=A0A5J5HZV3_9BACI|nr:hypothetical protein [Niallia endozanthoxylica]KAA9028428.1 hypothetical protein F4V44_03915 [Niallia endozanthoxylica]
MAAVKLVKIDGESIHVFNSAIYLFESSTGFTLELDMIVSEVAVKKYKNEKNLIIEIQLDDGRIISSIMYVKALVGRLPQLSLFCEINDPNEYPDLDRIHENDSEFPNIEDGITIEEIRKVEMPIEKISLKLKLPIDQVEWLQEQKTADLHRFFKDVIYDYWRKQTSK